MTSIHGPPLDMRTDTGTLDQLVESIQTNGLLQPLIVRPMDDGFEVVAGNRRFAACQKLGYPSVQCHILELDDKQAFEVSLVENVQRNTLNPIEEARAFRRYVDECGYGGVSELAKKIGKSQEHVSKRLQLLKLPEGVQREIIRRRITPSAAYELCCADSEYIEQLAEEMLSEKLSLREVRRIIKSYDAMQRQDDDKLASFSTLGDSSSAEAREKRTERGLKQCILSLKESMGMFDQAIERLDDTWSLDHTWIIKEMLVQQRQLLHEQIDVLLQMRSKMHKKDYPRFDSKPRSATSVRRPAYAR
jgi:ParB family chromosome partitioning protein